AWSGSPQQVLVSDPAAVLDDRAVDRGRAAADGEQTHRAVGVRLVDREPRWATDAGQQRPAAVPHGAARAAGTGRHSVRLRRGRGAGGRVAEGPGGTQAAGGAARTAGRAVHGGLCAGEGGTAGQ